MTTEKANEYAIESLKQIITLSSAILVLTITFLKDLLGSGRDDVKYAFLVPFGWASLLIGILLALMAIIGAADALGDGSTSTTGSPPSLPPGQTASQTANYVFKRNGGGVASLGQFLLAVLSWLIPIIPTTQKNENRKKAASAQNYFVIGLLLLGTFGSVNLYTALNRSSTRLKPVSASAQFIIRPAVKLKPPTAPPPPAPQPKRAGTKRPC